MAVRAAAAAADADALSPPPNFLCAERFGTDAYPLPCRAPKAEWAASPLAAKFVIAAWWPPT